jgi:hypothetical protein
VDSSVWATTAIYATEQTEVGVTRGVEFRAKRRKVRLAGSESALSDAPSGAARLSNLLQICSSEADAWVHRTPDWILPGQPVYITMNLTHEQVSLATLIRLRAPLLQPELVASIGLDDDANEARLALGARVLREYGDDLLRGDCSHLGTQRATMHDDVPPRAAVITLWVPETSESGQRATWAEAVRRQSPGVCVITRTYTPRPAPKRKPRDPLSN